MKKYLRITVSILVTALLITMVTACGSGDKAGDAGDIKNSEAAEQEERASDTKDKIDTDEEQGKEAHTENKKDSEEEQNEDHNGEHKEEQEMSTKEALDKVMINTQSSIRIEGSKTIYIDPYKRGEATYDADMILITHAHYDHYDEPSLRNVAGENTFIVCPDSMYDDVKSLGIRRGEIASMEPGAEIKPGARFDGITIKAVPAYNLNKSFHPKANGWLGYVITMDGVTYYAAGDTDALPELMDVKCDIAFVPIGGTYTMTATEAAGLVNKIAPEIAVPIHYGTIVGRAKDADTFGAALNKDIEMVKKVEDAK